MADTPTRDAKLVEFLNEAYAKEKQLETSLEAAMEATTHDAYAKRLSDHLKETKSHGTQVSRRIKQLGGSAETVSVPGPEGLGRFARNVSEKLDQAKAAAQGTDGRGAPDRRAAEDARQRSYAIRRRGAGDRDLHRDRGAGGGVRRQGDRQARARHQARGGAHAEVRRRTSCPSSRPESCTTRSRSRSSRAQAPGSSPDLRGAARTCQDGKFAVCFPTWKARRSDRPPLRRQRR